MINTYYSELEPTNQFAKLKKIEYTEKKPVCHSNLRNRLTLQISKYASKLLNKVCK